MKKWLVYDHDIVWRTLHIQPDSNRSHYLLAYANELTQEGLVARSEAP